jgi:hypothetical protein
MLKPKKLLTEGAPYKPSFDTNLDRTFRRLGFKPPSEEREELARRGDIRAFPRINAGKRG